MKSTFLLGTLLFITAASYQTGIYKAKSSAAAWFQHVHAHEFEISPDDDDDPFDRRGFTVNHTEEHAFNASGWRGPTNRNNGVTLYDPQTNEIITK